VHRIDAASALLQREARLVTVSAIVRGVATHPADDVVLATALSAGVDYLVTGDRELQKLGSFGGVTILSPRDFLSLLKQEEDRS
jgi:predicted nucleic acid-binding protein